MSLAVSTRKSWVDLLRAFAQLLVISGHLQFGNAFILTTTAVKIPLFFAISGYVFRDKGEKEFYTGLLKRLVLPWLALSMVRYVAGSFLRGPGYLLDGLYAVVMGKAAWFMPCTILAQIMHRYLRKLCRNGFLLSGVCFLCFGLGILLSRQGILDVMMFNRALEAQLFLLIGYFFSRLENKRPFSGWKLPAGLFGVYLLLCVLTLTFFHDCYFDIHNTEYFHLPLSLSMIFIGCLALMLLARHLNKVPRFLCFIGQNTLIFYIWEAYPRTIFKKGLSMVGLSLPEGMVGKLILMTVTVVGCSLAALVMNRFLPELVGKKRKRA